MREDCIAAKILAFSRLGTRPNLTAVGKIIRIQKSVFESLWCRIRRQSHDLKNLNFETPGFSNRYFHFHFFPNFPSM